MFNQTKELTYII